MAITRAQQAKQMLRQGGRTGFFTAGLAQGDDISPGTPSLGVSLHGGPSPGASNPRRPGGSEVFTPAASKSLNIDRGEIDRGEIDRIRNRRFLVEKPTFGMRVSDFIGGLPSIKFLKFLGEKGGTPVDAQGFGSGQGGGPQAMASAFIPAYIRAGFNTQEEYDEFLESQKEDAEVDDKIERSLAFRADGGPIGGEYDFESARQMYGLGKLVKKVTRTVKKIAKSPIGKAALLYVGAGGLGNLAAGKGFGSFFSGFTSPSTFLGRVPGIFTKSGLQNIGARIGFGGFENIGGERIFQKNILGKALTSPTGIVTATSLAAGLLTPEEEQQAQELADSSTDFDLEKARNSILAAKREQYMMDVRARGFKADGGRIEYQEGSKEPVAKKTMPLLDMGGKEMDLREEGGFVPIGRMEKADDVPARLSKNEFVFTADAVRNAGDGDVDKGAEVMYNMMKNLEAGGEVSEESQGLEGARKMFQTSQRLEEVL